MSDSDIKPTAVDIRKNYGTSPKLELEGAWTEDLGGGLKLKLARLKNPKFQKMYSRMMKPYQRQVRNGTLDTEVEERIITKCVVETVLLGWENLMLDGKIQEYSKENALRILSDPALSDFRDLVVDLANDSQLFREEMLVESEKNLSSGSDGKLNGENTSTC